MPEDASLVLRLVTGGDEPQVVEISTTVVEILLRREGSSRDRIKACGQGQRSLYINYCWKTISVLTGGRVSVKT